MGSRSKSKGSNFERQLCGKLSLWWSDGEDDDIFWRTAGSGARSTSRSRKQGKKTFGQAGDIQATNPCGQPLIDLFTIEMKCGYKEAHPGNEFDIPQRNKEQGLAAFVRQAADSAHQAATPYWLIIHKRDRRQEIVYWPDGLPELWQKKLFRKSKNFLYLRTPALRHYSAAIHGCSLQEFLEIVTPQMVLEHHREKIP